MSNIDDLFTTSPLPHHSGVDVSENRLSDLFDSNFFNVEESILTESITSCQCLGDHTTSNKLQSTTELSESNELEDAVNFFNECNVSPNEALSPNNYGMLHTKTSNRTNVHQFIYSKNSVISKRRLKQISDKDRSNIINRVYDILDYATFKRQQSPATLFPLPCINENINKTTTHSTAIPINDSFIIKQNKNHIFSIIPTIFLNRCQTETERYIFNSIITQGDVLPACSHISLFVRLLLNNTLLKLSDTTLKPVYSTVSQILINYCNEHGLKNNIKDSKTNQLVLHSNKESFKELNSCPSCQSNDILFDEHSESRMCHYCGIIISENKSQWESSSDNLFKSGRQFIESLGPYYHFSTSERGRIRLKQIVVAKTRTICQDAGIRSDNRITEISQLAARYALTARIARLRSVIGACCYLILRQHGESVTIGETATKLKLHSLTLGSLIVRIACVLNLKQLPSITIAEIIHNAIEQLFIVLEKKTTDHSFDVEDNFPELEQIETAISLDDYQQTFHPQLDTVSNTTVNSTELFNLESFDSIFESSSTCCTNQIEVESNEVSFNLNSETEKTGASDLLHDLLGSDTIHQETQSLNRDTDTALHELLCGKQFQNHIDKDADNENNKYSRCGSKRVKRQRIQRCSFQLILSKKELLLELIGKLLDIYKVANSEMNTIQTPNQVWKRIERRQLESVSVQQLHIIGSAIYFSARFLRIFIPEKLIAHILYLNNGSFNRVRGEFIGLLRLLLIKSGLWNNILIPKKKKLENVVNEKSSTKEHQLVIELIRSNFDILINFKL